MKRSYPNNMNLGNVMGDAVKQLNLGNKTKYIARFGGAFALFLIVLFSFSYTVAETEHAVVTRLGDVNKVVLRQATPELKDAILGDSKYKNVAITDKKGLHFKWPFIESVQKYKSTLITYDSSPREVTTQDKKKIILDNNAQWIVENPILFRNSMGSEKSANTRLDDMMFAKINEKVGKTEEITLISDTDYMTKMLEDSSEELNADLKAFGMKVVDIKIKRTELPPENSKNIYNRMNTERAQKAKQYRSEGDEEKQKIMSDVDKDVKTIISEAERQAKDIKGQGDAEATAIYNEAYNKDPEFYEFYRTLQAYKKTLGTNTKIVIDSNSPFAKYLFGK